MTFEELEKIIKSDDAESLRAALDDGGDVNMVGDANWSLLMLAACMNSVNCTDLLIQKEAKVDHQSDYGQTALVQAAQNAAFSCIQLLLEKKANPALTDQDGLNALMHAYRGGERFDDDTRACMELLLSDSRVDPIVEINHVSRDQDDETTTLLIEAARIGDATAVNFSWKKGQI